MKKLVFFLLYTAVHLGLAAQSEIFFVGFCVPGPDGNKVPS